MRILMMLHNLGGMLAGMEWQAVRLAKRLLEEGLEVAFVTLRPPEEDVGFTGPIHTFPFTTTLPGLRRASWLAALAVHLPRLLRAHDLLHVHQATIGAAVAVTAAHATGRKVLVKLACSGLYGDLRVMRGQFLGPRAARRLLEADHFVALTRESKRELTAEGVAPERVSCIPNGVDAGSFRPASGEERAACSLPGPRRFAYLGRLEAYKGVHTLLDAWALLARQAPQCHLFFAGAGPERARLEARIRHLDLKDRVHLLGTVADSAALLRGCDGLLLPSESEGMSNALLEAMGTGLPVIASDIEANREVADTSCGLFVPLGDAGAIAASVLELLEKPELAVRLGSAGRARVLERFALESVATGYRRLYERLLARP
ncbi:MAG: glycosyltransferase family 4 protein [Candidatus Wallbacteria bacterium]|nr:glycosyltransferase family 4 protein [Candidatus Wallbacteria bacterium]